MKYTQLTPEQYIKKCLALISKGWFLVGDHQKQEMKFARGNKTYNLSAVDLSKLKEIEEKGLFII